MQGMRSDTKTCSAQCMKGDEEESVHYLTGQNYILACLDFLNV